MARRTKAEAMETREQILDAAELVFHRKGVSCTSLNDIAAEAGVTRGAIYWHFKNKHDVFIAMAERRRVPFDTLLRQAMLPDEPDPLGAIRAVMVTMLNELASDPQKRRLFEIYFLRCEYTAETLPLLNHRQDGFRQVSGYLAEGFRNAVRREQLPAGLDINKAVVQFHAQLTGLIFTWLLQPESFCLRQQGTELVDGFLHTLRHCPYLQQSDPVANA
ncbi:transcriptional regulator TtgR [Isoalcanivorax pacificus W11-5]|uniref:Transcriptional regulator TtgR n=1 Tax=Isoalcanivorax pacificus W11-5 TaxID=391936 RepID=A0A0B4XMJ3_9GAMM|nr:TetR family transcriptional regulator [Isoalcanivorax pacificus]AJD47870.1 transcriptional regulator TtgR [Isoalcanivorax pacificus W11-5]